MQIVPYYMTGWESVAKGSEEARAGFDPHAAISLWEKMQRIGASQPPQFLSTHPANDTRIKQIEANLPRVRPLYEQARKPS